MIVKFKKMGYWVGIPFGCWMLYVLLCRFLQGFYSFPPIASMVVVDVICSCLFGFVFYLLCVKPKPKTERKLFRFTGTALLLLFVLFIWSYVFGQSTSAWVAEFMPSEYMSVYRDRSGMELQLYLLLAVSFGPVFEELLFRGLFFRHLRNRFGFIFSLLLSSFAFSFSHGTTEHIPVTIALSLFICFVYELTDNMLYCILIHIFCNLVSMAYVIVVPISFGFSVFMFVLYISVMFGLYAFIPFFRKWMAYDPNRQTLVDRLENKRKHWGDS